MKTKTNTHLLIGSSLTLVVVLALTLIIWSPGLSQSAEPAEGRKMMETPMMKCCQDMKAQKDKMWKDLKAEDAALTKQVAKMNSSPEEKKMTLMAALITRMVEQRATTNTCMARMQDDMMQHMMQCPMMMGAKDMAKKPMVAPSEHPEHPK